MGSRMGQGSSSGQQVRSTGSESATFAGNNPVVLTGTLDPANYPVELSSGYSIARSPCDGGSGGSKWPIKEIVKGECGFYRLIGALWVELIGISQEVDRLIRRAGAIWALSTVMTR